VCIRGVSVLLRVSMGEWEGGGGGGEVRGGGGGGGGGGRGDEGGWGGGVGGVGEGGGERESKGKGNGKREEGNRGGRILGCPHSMKSCRRELFLYPCDIYMLLHLQNLMPLPSNQFTNYRLCTQTGMCNVL